MKNKNLMAIAIIGLMVGSAIAFAPNVLAGTEQGPEITDAEGDTTPPAAGVPFFDQVDVISAWISDETESAFNMAIKVKDIPDATGPISTGTAFGYGFWFTIGDVTLEFYVTFKDMTEAGPVDRYEIWDVDGNKVGDVPGSFDASTNVIVGTIPKDMVGKPAAGDVMSGLYVRNIYFLDGDEFASDRAPDSGSGRDYTFTGGIPTGPSSSGGIALTSDKTEASVANGVPATYNLTLTSNKTETTTVALTSNTVDKWEISISPNTMEVPAGRTATATLSVTPTGQVAADEKAVVTVNATFTGGYASIITTTTSQGGEVTNKKPVAAFTHTVSGLKVSVDASGSSDPDGDTLTYSWNWGDSTSAGTGKTAEHTYAKAGTYTIKLTASDGKGGSDIKSIQVTLTSTSGGSSGGGFIPGFDVALLTAALGVCALMVKRRRR